MVLNFRQAVCMKGQLLLDLVLCLTVLVFNRRVEGRRALGTGHDLGPGITPSPMEGLRSQRASAQTRVATLLQA